MFLEEFPLKQLREKDRHEDLGSEIDFGQRERPRKGKDEEDGFY